MKKLIICLMLGIILMVSAHISCNNAKNDINQMCHELQESNMIVTPVMKGTIDGKIFIINWTKRVLIATGFLIVFLSLFELSRLIETEFGCNYVTLHLNSKFIDIYLKVIKPTFKIVIMALCIIVSVIAGVIFGPLIFWIDGLDIAIADEKKGTKRIGKMILFPILWGLCGVFRGPNYILQNLTEMF